MHSMRTYTTFATYKNGIMKTYTIHYASAQFKGNGHYQITVQLMDENGNVQSFHETTANMRNIDESTELEGQEKYQLLFDTIESAIEDEVNTWLESILN